ncbi:MAG: CDC48 family AAA ATPase [Candidatus Micrarchaeota archaeon]
MYSASNVPASKKELVLTVFDPDPGHVGRNIITLDRQSKETLGVTSGDIVEIEGNGRKTAAVIWPARAEDEGKATIRMDNFLRHNAGVGLGEKVTVRSAEVKEAKKVVLAPTQEIRIIASGYDRILKKNFIGRPLVRGDSVWISVFGSGFVYTVVDTTPRGIVKVNDFTQFILKEQPIKETIGISKRSYDDLGGLQEQVRKVREMIELPMRHPELFRKLGINPPKGVLLFGPPGTGKTLLAKAVANETNAHFISIAAPALMSKFVGEAEERIRQVFKEAEDSAPSIIFFDEIDAVAPKRDEVIGEVERRVVAQLLASMDGMEARGAVVVIAATNRVNSLDEALRRPGRFDREVEFPVPDKNGRLQILQIHTRGMPIKPAFDISGIIDFFKKGKQTAIPKVRRDELIGILTKNGKDEAEFWKVLSESEYSEISEFLRYKMLEEFASVTHGFVGADLEALTKESAMKALRRYLEPGSKPMINLEDETIPSEILEQLQVEKKDFLDGLKEVQASALREITIEIPDVHWADIGGLEDIKEELKQAVEWPLENPQIFNKMGIRPPRGILLYGPPGTGKTLLVKAVATESKANFISIKGPELVSMWLGESEKAIRKVFKKARQVAPVIVFFDEFDSIATSRGISVGEGGSSDRVVNQLLTEIDGIKPLEDVVVIAATNRPDLIDPGLLRQGRFDKIIRTPSPDEKARLQILLVKTKGVPLDENVSLESLAKSTIGFSGADLDGLVREAALMALKESKLKATKIAQRHIDEVLKKLAPSISTETEEAYAEFKLHKGDFKPSYIE